MILWCVVAVTVVGGGWLLLVVVGCCWLFWLVDCCCRLPFNPKVHQKTPSLPGPDPEVLSHGPRMREGECSQEPRPVSPKKGW